MAECDLPKLGSENAINAELVQWQYISFPS